MSAPDLTEFANHIRNVFSQRPDTTYYDLPGELMKDFRLTNVEDAESFIDEFADQEEVKITLIAAGWRYGTQKEEEEVNSPITTANLLMATLVGDLLSELFHPIPEDLNTPIEIHKWEEGEKRFDEQFDLDTLFDDLYWDLVEETM